MLAPATSPIALNPSELAARGAAIQAALLRDVPADDLKGFSDPQTADLLHLRHPVGVLLGPDNADAPFRPVLLGQTAVPVRRSVTLDAPAGGDVTVKVCEGTSHVVVNKPEAKPKKEKAAKGDSDDEDDEDEDDESDEEEETREKVWKVGTLLGELTVAGVPAKGGKIEVDVDVSGALAVTVRARAAGSEKWATLQLEAPAEEGAAANGSA